MLSVHVHLGGNLRTPEGYIKSHTYVNIIERASLRLGMEEIWEVRVETASITASSLP